MNKNLENCGLPQASIIKLCNTFNRISELDKVVLYGSRAKGNFRRGSDIDLCLFGDLLNSSHLLLLDEQIDELLLPYTCDLSIWQHINNADLREHIERVGILFYQKNKVSIS